MSNDEIAKQDFIDILDDYFSFKAREADALNSGYAGYVYGHLEFNEVYARDRAAIAERIRVALLTAPVSQNNEPKDAKS